MKPGADYGKAGDSVELLGVRIDRIDLVSTLEQIDAFIAVGAPHQHAVVNASKLVAVQRDPRLATILRSCDLVTADGQSVVWASRLVGRPLPERVTGIDLMTELLVMAAAKKYRVFFLGAREDVVDRVVERCRKEFQGLQVAGWHSGFFDDQEEQDVLSEIRSSRPHILFVALGSPNQEFWLASHLAELSVPFSMGVGGSFDVLAGDVKRAPLWMQRHGLEWLFRLVQEPGRLWRRYLTTNLEFAWLVGKSVLSQFFTRRGRAA